ncbi:hypothetical protein IKE67_02455 [bacterium]|nr:hypothetical protein [bacterium]
MNKQLSSKQYIFVQPERASGCTFALSALFGGGGVKHLSAGRSSPPADSGGDAMCR